MKRIIFKHFLQPTHLPGPARPGPSLGLAFMMLLFLGLGAFVLDIGHAFYCYRELQAATDAAALAGAQQLKTNNPLTACDRL